MIKETTVNIKITHRNKNIYKKYDIIDVNKEYSININDVNKNSKVKITAICDICGKENIVSIQKYFLNKNNYNLYTCRSCSFIKNKKTNLKKYGVEHHMQNYDIYHKMEETNLKKYGTKNIFENNEIKEKIKQTNIKKYGVEYVMQNKEILQKNINTNIKKYGVNRPAQNKNIIKKMSDTSFKHLKLKFNKLNLIKRENNTLTIKCDKCNKIYDINIKTVYSRYIFNVEICTFCNPIQKHYSFKEKQMCDFIRKIYSGKIIENDRKILNGLEIDILLPEISLGFEFNGNYWHSELYKDEHYHSNKVKNALKKNVKLYHIWENEWDNNNIRVFIEKIIKKHENT